MIKKRKEVRFFLSRYLTNVEKHPWKKVSEMMHKRNEEEPIVHQHHDGNATPSVSSPLQFFTFTM
jgi:hypothetical protein